MTHPSQFYITNFLSLPSDGWFSPDTYDPDFAEPPRSPGIYCVLARRVAPADPHCEIAYVGMSENLAERITRSHEAVKAVQDQGLFAQRYFKLCRLLELRAEERRMIRRIQPRLNIIGRQEALR